MLPIAMVTGLLFHEPINMAQGVVPYLIFLMLFITFSKVEPSELRFDGMIWRLLAVQTIGSAAVFYALRSIDLPIAQSMMVCVLCPTATAAPVVTGMLGGRVGRVVAYSIVGNLVTAIFAPVMFVLAGTDAEVGFWREFVLIVSKVAPMIVLPFVLARALYYVAPRVHGFVAGSQRFTFYIWAVALMLVVGKAVNFVMSEPPSAIPSMLVMGLGAGVLCFLQFRIGRAAGLRYGDPVSGAQALGQKNTILAVWMSLNYLNPISSVGPAAYILWHNTVNSMQLYQHMKHVRQAGK